MNIAELFINLGIKGAEKTVGALGQVSTGLGGVASSSLEVKAAVVGALYGLERLMSTTAQQGTALTNFNAQTGYSTQALQKWQYAARQAGVSNEEFEGSIKSVQANMTNMLTGGAAPKYFGLLAKSVGFDMTQARNAFYVTAKMNEYIKQAPVDIGNMVGQSFGYSMGTLGAMRRGTFNQKNFDAAPSYSDGEIKNLDKVNIGWSNVMTKMQMGFGHFNAKYGPELIKNIGELVPKVLSLMSSFTELAERLQVFKVIGAIFDGWVKIFDLLKGTVDTIANKDASKNPWGTGVYAGARKANADLGQAMYDVTKGMFSSLKDMVAPDIPTLPPQQNHAPVLNQNLNFNHDGKDAVKTKESVKGAYYDALNHFNSVVA